MDETWARLYDEHSARVRALVYRMCGTRDVDDLVQECFIKIWKGMSSFRGDSSAKTWVNRIAMNVVYDHYRKRETRTEFQEFDETSSEVVEKLSDRSEGRTDGDLIQQALQSLSVEHREVLVLHVIEENSIDEVAETLGIAGGTVKSRLYHARENMKKALSKRGIKNG